MLKSIGVGGATALSLMCSCLLACEEETAVISTTEADAGAPTSPAVDPNIAAAVREVAKAPPTPTTAGDTDTQEPPPNGVFGPGEANKEIAPGEPAKLALGTTGGSPKVTLKGVVLEPEKPRELAATIAVRTGPRAALPSVDLSVKLKAEVPKGEAEGPDPNAGLVVIGRVESARPSKEQPGTLPPGVEKQIEKLTGSRLDYRLSDGGGLSSMKVEVSRGVEEALGRVVEGVGELAGTLHTPYPKEPVGPGAYWMVTSRERYIGLDVVAYRMFKVEKVEGTEATVSVNTKRYVAGGQVTFPGLPKHEVDEFRGEGRGELVIDATGGLVRGRVQDTLLSNLAPEGEPQRRITIQLDVTSTLALVGR